MVSLPTFSHSLSLSLSLFLLLLAHTRVVSRSIFARFVPAIKSPPKKYVRGNLDLIYSQFPLSHFQLYACVLSRRCRGSNFHLGKFRGGANNATRFLIFRRVLSCEIVSIRFLFALHHVAFDSGCSKWPSYRDLRRTRARNEGKVRFLLLSSVVPIGDPGMMNISLVIGTSCLYIVEES